MSTQAATTTTGDTPAAAQPTISRNVRLLMAAAEWDQSDLAAAVGLSEPQVSRKMKNKGSSWTPDDLLSMASAFSGALGLDISPGSFFDDPTARFASGSFSPALTCLDIPIGQGSLLDTDLAPLDFYSRAELASV